MEQLSCSGKNSLQSEQCLPSHLRPLPSEGPCKGYSLAVLPLPKLSDGLRVNARIDQLSLPYIHTLKNKTKQNFFVFFNSCPDTSENKYLALQWILWRQDWGLTLPTHPASQKTRNASVHESRNCPFPGIALGWRITLFKITFPSWEWPVSSDSQWMTRCKSWPLALRWDSSERPVCSMASAESSVVVASRPNFPSTVLPHRGASGLCSPINS